MKSILKFFLSLFCLFLIASCSDEQADESLKPPESHTAPIQKRNPNNDPFYDLLFAYNELSIQAPRYGTYQFVDDVMATLQNSADSESIYESFRQNNIFPCWNCAEPEYNNFHNYYIPFYDLGTSRLDGILIAQEKNNEKKFHYLSKNLVDLITSVRVEPYSQYWSGIMNYFDLSSYPQGRDDVFVFSKLPCILYNSGNNCGCPYINDQGLPDYWYCTVPDFLNDPCDVGKCPLGTGGDNNGAEDTSIFDIANWTSFDGGEGNTNTGGTNNNNGTGGSGNNNNNNSNNHPDWVENCDSYDGSLPELPVTDGGEIVIDASTGTIALDHPQILYEMQVLNFIEDYDLAYTPKELMDIIGEKCAVSDVTEVRNCLKCHFITPLGLSNEESWNLSENFDLVAECESEPNPADCIDCKFTLKSLKLPNGNSLSSSEIATIETNLDCSSFDCLADNPALVETVLVFLEIYNGALSNPNSDDINQIFTSMNGCSPMSFIESLNAHFNITSEPSQQNTLPSLPIGSTLCAGIFDIQDVQDGIHEVGAISGLRFDVVNSNGQMLTLNFDHVVLMMDSNIDNPNCPGSTVANLMAQAVNETIAFIRGEMGNVLSYNDISSPDTFHEVLSRILEQKSASCVAHGNGGSAEAKTTNNPEAETAFSNASFVQLTNDHISNNNGADCQ